jgi:hypothetical protein
VYNLFYRKDEGQVPAINRNHLINIIFEDDSKLTVKFIKVHKGIPLNAKYLNPNNSLELSIDKEISYNITSTYSVLNDFTKKQKRCGWFAMGLLI